jgi:hypothetical protein
VFPGQQEEELPVDDPRGQGSELLGFPWFECRAGAQQKHLAFVARGRHRISSTLWEVFFLRLDLVRSAKTALAWVP